MPSCFRSDVAGLRVLLQAPRFPIVSETQPGSSDTLGLLWEKVHVPSDLTKIVHLSLIPAAMC